jgi:hypothetical protein
MLFLHNGSNCKDVLAAEVGDGARALAVANQENKMMVKTYRRKAAPHLLAGHWRTLIQQRRPLGVFVICLIPGPEVETAEV